METAEETFPAILYTLSFLTLHPPPLSSLGCRLRTNRNCRTKIILYSMLSLSILNVPSSLGVILLLERLQRELFKRLYNDTCHHYWPLNASPPPPQFLCLVVLLKKYFLYFGSLVLWATGNAMQAITIKKLWIFCHYRRKRLKPCNHKWNP